ncbi:MAG: hypothetical protein ACI9OE_002847 [Mariniflexile sp.]|jgi:hypothetical protein
MSLLYSRKFTEVTLVFLPLLAGLLLFGGSRVIMVVFFVFTFFCIKQKRGFNFGFFSILVYFLYANIGFLVNVVKTGKGFN